MFCPVVFSVIGGGGSLCSNCSPRRSATRFQSWPYLVISVYPVLLSTETKGIQLFKSP